MAFQFGIEFDHHAPQKEVICPSKDTEEEEKQIGKGLLMKKMKRQTEAVQQMAYCVEKAGSFGGRVLAVEIPQPERVAQLNYREEFQSYPSSSAAMTSDGKFPVQ